MDNHSNHERRGIAFDVNFSGDSSRANFDVTSEPHKKPGTKSGQPEIPKRYRRKSTRPKTAEDIQERQRMAEQRRKDLEEARLRRIQEKDAHCKRITDAMSRVLGDEGQPGRRERLTRRENADVIRTVQTELDAMNRISGMDDNFFKK